jgi:protoheme IX farnesyltransferase
MTDWSSTSQEAPGFAPVSIASISMAGPNDYFELMKPRVMSLVVFTALVGMVLAPGGLHPVLAAISLLCIAVGAGASGALNMWYDADIDRLMSRTRGRPVPSGRVTAEEALAFGATMSVFSVLVLAVTANFLAAGLLAFTILFYVVVYTMWLKRSTPQNIVIGGAAGAFPPMVGWAAMTGSISIESIVLFLIIFMWTPPHFWALALLKSNDYATAGVPMLPVVAGETATRHQILIYAVLMALVGVAPAVLGFGGLAYALVSSASGLVFVGLAARVWRIREGAPARKAAGRLFAFSILYLFLLYAVLLVERVVGAIIG